MNQNDPYYPPESPFNQPYHTGPVPDPALQSGPVPDPALQSGPVPDPANQKPNITLKIVIIRLILCIGLIAGTWALSGLFGKDIIYNNSVFIDNMQPVEGTIVETYTTKEYTSRNIERHGPEYRTKKLIKVRYEVDGTPYEEDVYVTYALVEANDFSADKVLDSIDTTAYRANTPISLYYSKENARDVRIADDLMIRHIKNSENRFWVSKFPHYVGIFFYIILWIIIIAIVLFLLITLI